MTRSSFPRRSAASLAAAAAILFAIVLPGPALALDPSLRLTQYMHDSWTTNEGMPQDSVNDIAQTPDGYLWLATQEGLARFDGTRFTVFDSRTTHGAIGNFVYTLHVDPRGTLWIGASIGNVGLIRYDGDGRFTKFGREEGWSGTAAKYISEDRSGAFWVGLGNGTNIGGKGLLRYANHRVRSFTTAEGLANNQVYQTWTAPDGALWIATGEGLSVMRDGRFTTYGVRDGLPDAFVRSVRGDRSGNIWIGTRAGLSCLRDGAFRTYTTRDGLLDDEIYSIYEDSDGVIWIGTGRGVNRIAGGRIESIDPGLGTLPSDRIFAFFEDREKSLWIGTHASGLHRLRAGRFTPVGSPEGLRGESVTSLFEDRSGRLWIGTSTGDLNVSDGKGWTQLPAPENLSMKGTTSILEDRRGTFWLATSDGLFRYAGGRIERFADDALPDRTIQSLHEGRDGTLWIGTGAGLAKFVNGKVETVALPAVAPSSIRLMHEDRRGRLWIGGGDGAGYFHDGRYVPVLTSPTQDLNVVSVTEDRDGTLWFSTWNSGIFRVKDGKSRLFTTADGLYDDIGWGIVDDGLGYFWISSNRGIYRVARKELVAVADGRLARVTPVVYGTHDGMRSRETNLAEHAILRRRDGTLWFATTSGAVTIDPRHIRLNRLAPPVVIEHLVAGEKVISASDGQIVLPAGTRSIEIEYAAPSLNAASQVRYRYKLEGFDEHWVDAGNRRTAYYTNIDPGPYVFRVIAANEDGVWNVEGASLDFRLRPLFHQTWWFYALVVLGLIGLGAAILMLRQRQREIRHQVYHDPLTGLPNRRLLTERGQVALTLATRKNHSIAILFLDLDGFKGVNDTMGHAAGDRLLQLVAARLRGCIRDIDTLARIGGDEFALLVADITDEARAAEVAQRLIAAMNRSFSFDGYTATLGVSIGIAIHPFDGTDVGTMLQAADRAMYRAKLAGGNSYQFNAADPDETVTIT